MELHPSRELVASGQRAGRGRRAQAHVRIWSTDTLQTLHVFGMAEFEAGVSAVVFSQLVTFLNFLSYQNRDLQWIFFLLVNFSSRLAKGSKHAFFSLLSVNHSHSASLSAKVCTCQFDFLKMFEVLNMKSDYTRNLQSWKIRNVLDFQVVLVNEQRYYENNGSSTR